MRERAIKAIKPAAILLAAGFAYFILHELTGLSLFCPIYRFLGLYCPGCGVSRLCIHLLHGEIGSAFSSNCAVFCLLPIGMTIWLIHTYRYIRYGETKYTRFENIVLCTMIGLLVIFGIVRNIWHFDILIP